MKVIVDGHVYDGKKDIVVVMLTDSDKKNIKNMNKECNIYCEFPDDMDIEKVNGYLAEIKKGQVFG